MSEKIYQILYCSRNNIGGTAAETRAEVDRILAASRRNNAAAGVTGALFYTTVFFAQVLEGAFVDVQRVFERLQLDPRHSDLVVLQSGFVEQRDFEEWSMAYAGASSDFDLPFPPKPLGNSKNSGKVLSFLRDVVVKQENWALPERPSSVRPIGSGRPVA